jgi:Ca2+-binding RTX toxin-like protein
MATINGTKNNDTLNGTSGNDTINGLAGNDIINGLAGNDTINGGDGNDTITGGAGNDTLVGGAGNDTYVFAAGFGQDIISENDSKSGNLDTVKFAAGITAGNVLVTRDLNNLYLSIVDINGIPTGDKITVSDFFVATANQIEQVTFADGTVWNVATLISKASTPTSGDDILYGTSGNDTIDGLGGNDTIYGLGGNDTLIGNSGKDTIYGGTGNDTLSGNGGADILYGGDGSDSLNGGAGNDTLYGEAGDDTLAGGAGDDILYGGGGKDSLNGGAGFDTLYGEAGDDTLDGGADNDFLYGFTGNDTYVFDVGSGNDIISDVDSTSGNSDKITIGAGILPSGIIASRDMYDLFLTIKSSGEMLTVKDFFLASANQIEQVVFANGTTWNAANITAMFPTTGTPGDDLIYGTSGNDIISTNGRDTVYGLAGNDTITAGINSGEIYGGDGDDVISANSGGSDIYGGAGKDTITINGFDSTVRGGTGNDTYIVSKNSPHFDLRDNGATADVDTIRFTDVASTDIRLEMNWEDLRIYTSKSGENHVHLRDVFRDDANRIENFQFTDRTLTFAQLQNMMTSLTVTEGNDNLIGTSGNDTISGLGGDDDIFGMDGNDTLNGGAGSDDIMGGAGNDTLDGGAGNDWLDGGQGNDTYKFGIGSGNDELREQDRTSGNVDTILLGAGITTADITLSRDGNTFFLTINSTGERLTMYDYFEANPSWDGNEATYFDRKIEQIRFANGTTWNEQTILQKLGMTGTANGEYLTGTNSADTINGGAGDDNIYAMGGNDTISGDAGNDYIEGRSGNDTYLWGGGLGNDTIYDNDNTTDNSDTIKLTNLNQADVKFTRWDNTLYVTATSGETLTINEFFTSDGNLGRGVIERFQFSDNSVLNAAAVEQLAVSAVTEGDNFIVGTYKNDVIDGLGGNDRLQGMDGNDTLRGGAGDDGLEGGKGNDTLDGGAGNDWMNGGAGNDTYLWGSAQGSDSINDEDATNSGSIDTVKLTNLNPGDVTLSRNYDGLFITVTATGETLTISNYFNPTSGGTGQIEQIVFQDGTIWNPAAVFAMVNVVNDSNNFYVGGAGNDIVDALAGDDTVYGMAGNDTLTGGSGNDSLIGGLGIDNLFGGTGDDSLDGGAGSDTITGGTGNDWLYGHQDGDTYIYSKGDGSDYIWDQDSSNSGIDILKFTDLNPTDVTLSREWRQLYVSIKISETETQTLTIENYFSDTGQSDAAGRIEQIQFADGTTWDVATITARASAATEGDNFIVGTAGNDALATALNGLGGNDMIIGLAGNDSITGGLGNDDLRGNAGGDTYVYSKGDGSDYIWDEDRSATSSGSTDTLKFSDLNAGDITLTRNEYQVFVTVNATGERITLENQLNDINSWAETAAGRIEQIQFADGTVWSAATIAANTIHMTTGNDFIVGTAGSDTIDALAGDDTVYGMAGNDELTGNDGNDTLIGGLGNDKLFGGQGNDSLQGEAGSDEITGGAGDDALYGHDGGDTYFYAKGDGRDYLYDADGSNIGTDTLKFTDLNQGDLAFSRDNSRLYITVKSNGETITIEDYFNEFSAGSGRIEVISFANNSSLTKDQVVALLNIPTPGNDLIVGTAAADSIDALAGDDTVYGMAGDDTLIGNDGNDNLIGGLGADKLTGGQGNDTLQGDAGSDTLTGGAGNDTLYGLDGGDTYVYARGDGSDYVWDQDWSATRGTSIDTLKFTDLNSGDITVNRNQHQIFVTVKGTTDTLTLEYQFNDLYPWVDTAAGKIEQFVFANGEIWDAATIAANTTHITTGNDFIIGTAGNDNIDALTGDDTVYGMGGDDSLTGNAGNDTLIGGVGNDVLAGGSGNDSLQGEAGDDALTGGTGNDSLHGHDGSDTYVYASSDGSDYIWDADGSATRSTSIDTLKFTDLNAGDITVTRNQHQIFVNVNATGERLTLENQFNDLNPGVDMAAGKIEQFMFQNGETWDAATIAANTAHVTTGNDFIIGTAGNDTINALAGDDTVYGLGGDDTINGGSGNDTLIGGTGDDTLTGGTGNDTLQGESGSDTINGGKGNDSLYGHDGGDTYVYARGDGSDYIWDQDWSATRGSSIDTLKFTDLNSDEITVTRNEYQVFVTVNATGERLTLEYQFNDLNPWVDVAAGKIEQFVFQNGEIWDAATIAANTAHVTTESDFIIGTAGADTIDALGGNDTVYGLGGDDTLYGNDGNDNLLGGTGDDQLIGGLGNDTLQGNEGNDTLTGGAGNDALHGHDGGDTYVYTSGDGSDYIWDADGSATRVTSIDTLQFTNLNASDITVTRNQHQIFVTVNATGETLTLENQFNDIYGWIDTAAGRIEQFQFADGTTWDAATIIANVSAATEAGNYLVGTPGNDTIDGAGGNDTIFGMAGDDTIIGGTGNDGLYGLAGGDTYVYAKGDGSDYIWDQDGSNSGIDKIQFTNLNAADITLTREFQQLYVTVNETGERLTIEHNFSDLSTAGEGRIEQFVFADGTSWDMTQIAAAASTPTAGDNFLVGTTAGDTINALGGNDTVYGQTGNDTISGGTGNDSIHGDGGSDTYLFASGDGSDILYDYDTSTGNSDTLRFTDLNSGDATLSRTTEDLILSFASGDSVRLANYFYEDTNYAIETISFADGISWDFNTVATMLQVEPSAGADIIYGTNSAETINAQDGDDTVYGLAGNDTLNGDAGNDSLYGGTGIDILNGGLGDDYLNGSSGDTLNGGDGNDTLQGGYGTTLSGGAGDDSLIGDNGYYWSSTAGNDLLIGGEGNDSLYGYYGNDVYEFSRGFGADTIYENAVYNWSDDTIRFTDISSTDVTATRVGDQLILNVANSTDTVTVVQQFSKYSSWDAKIEHVQFADGVSWDTTDIQRKSGGTATAGDDTLWGTDGNDTINGLGGNDVISTGWGDDTLIGGAGNDTLYGGEHNDTYDFTAAGFGSDVIVETYPSYYWYPSGTDTVKFGVNPLDLVFSGNNGVDANLAIAVNGTSDNVTLQNWYYDGHYQTEIFTAADGRQLLNTQVDALVQAMSTFCTEKGFNTWNDAIAGDQAGVEAVLSQYWSQPQQI